VLLSNNIINAILAMKNKVEPLNPVILDAMHGQREAGPKRTKSDIDLGKALAAAGYLGH